MIETDRKWAVSCYIPVINVLTCSLAAVRRVNSRYCRFHVRQGLILFVLWFFTIIIALISQVLSLMLWGIVLFLHLFGGIIAYSNKETKIPLVGQFADKIPEYYLFVMLTGKAPDPKVTEEPEPTAEDKPNNNI